MKRKITIPNRPIAATDATQRPRERKKLSLNFGGGAATAQGAAGH
ncbi:hypothetical protein SPHINGO361_110310 [Sphingomonas sp. EC-HK361]|nr:hypothetical protein [Sphingomonas sp. EC-HK361]VVT04526.1 hypothetical protein SPHINGO361_110310 [Sphingomonas sp. EC-HK361]